MHSPNKCWAFNYNNFFSFLKQNKDGCVQREYCMEVQYMLKPVWTQIYPEPNRDTGPASCET